MNPQEFMSKWIEGIKNTTPLQQLHAKMIGNIGALIGMCLAFIVITFYQKMWWWGIFLFFMVWLQFYQYISSRQQYMTAMKVMEEIEKQQVREP